MAPTTPSSSPLSRGVYTVTWGGDATLDHSVGFADLLALAKNYGQTSTTGASGDFDYSHTTDFADLLTLAKNYGSGSAGATDAQQLAALGPAFAGEWSLAQALVPEPVSLACLVGCVMLAGSRRRRMR